MSRAVNMHQILCKLEHSSIETILMIRKAAAMGNWWLAASSQQHGYFITTLLKHAEFFWETSNHQATQSSYSPDLAPCDFWLFPKLKSPLKGKKFQTVHEIQENRTGQLMAIGRTVWGPKVPTLKRIEASLSYVQWFLYLVSSSVNVSIFHITWLDTFWQNLYIKLYINIIYIYIPLAMFTENL